METPSISNANYSTSTYSGDALFESAVGAAGVANLISPRRAKVTPVLFQQEVKPMTNTSRRIVKVFIADPDDNVPLADSVIYSGDEKLTDLNDNELFFEVDIKPLLASHNEKRAKIVNKKVKERTEMLEPARIRDLRMVVVTVAQF